MIISASRTIYNNILKKRSINIDSIQIPCYDYTETKQCWTCQTPSHVSAGCTSDPVCKFCSGQHTHHICTDKSKLKCIRCHRHNKTSSSIPPHNSNYDSCPFRAYTYQKELQTNQLSTSIIQQQNSHRL